MKQRVTIEQLNELTDEQKVQLRKWWMPQRHDVIAYRGNDENIICIENDGSFHIETDCLGGHNAQPDQCLPLLSIGQMMELLNNVYGFSAPRANEVWSIWLVELRVRSDELCDDLWKIMKSKLCEQRNGPWGKSLLENVIPFLHSSRLSDARKE